LRRGGNGCRHNLQRSIIEAATALFVELGFGATTIDQIATAAKVSPQTIYATYGSKAAVLFRAIDVAVAGDYDEAPLLQRVPVLADASDGQGVHFRGRRTSCVRCTTGWLRS
jgi:AcrR family transcriptional regulator